MTNKIMYWLGAISTFFPLWIIPIPLWLSVVLTILIFLFSMFLPFASPIAEAVFWIWGIIELFFSPINWITILGFMAFIFWLVSTITFYYAIFKSSKSK